MKRKNIITFLLSFLITSFMVIGTSFIMTGDFRVIKKHPLITLLSFILLIKIFWEIIKYLFDRLDNKKDKEKDIKAGKLGKLFDKHPFIFSILFIILLWLVYIIAFYPAIMSPDPSFQLLQYFNINNKYSDYVVLIDKNVILTNHHPVVHTIILGSLVKLGIKLFSSLNAGLFIYSIIQTIILASTLSYTIKFMKDIKVSLKYRKICLLIYSLVPVFPLYAMSPVKDVIFGCLIIIYIISFYNMINLKGKLKIKDMVMEMLLIILIILFRNNGFHIVLLSLLFLLFLGRQNIFKYIIIICITITLYYSYNNVILPHFKITNGSIREVLSVPFQQTARYVKEYKKEVTSDEKKAIDKLLNYDTIASRYNPALADPVKNEFNRYYTDDDLKNYFKVWFTQLKKHPLVYVEATIANTYGYIYPVETNWYVHIKGKKIINNYGFDYHFNENLRPLRMVLGGFATVFPYIPFIGLLINIGFNTWILLFMLSYLFYRKKYKDIIFLIPSFLILLVCFVSPANTYFRYALPNVFALPLMLLMFNKIISKKDK